jgi:endonuclease/exonuclease/phosphatase family metal-dependent hydrolase
MRKWLAIVGVGGLIVLGGLFAGLRSAFYFPADVEEAPVACPADAQVAPRGTPIRVLVWNIQFSANREQQFFYDGGQAVSVPPIQVERTLDRIARFISDQNADIVLLQEVDRNSRRTGRLDQHAMLRERLDLPCHTAVPYHRAAYVPIPSHEPMGRVDMNLYVFSRYRIDTSTRHQLPLLQESAVRRMFNLRRAVLSVSIPLQGGGSVSLMNTHLSAFSRNDGTLERQVSKLDELAGALESSHTPWLLAGDFNALPPGDPPSRIDNGEIWYGAQSAVAPLFERYSSPFPSADTDAVRTYVPWGSTEPDRTIDYLFHGAGVEVSDLVVHRETYPLSDHLPFTITVVIP